MLVRLLPHGVPRLASAAKFLGISSVSTLQMVGWLLLPMMLSVSTLRRLCVLRTPSHMRMRRLQRRNSRAVYHRTCQSEDTRTMILQSGLRTTWTAGCRMRIPMLPRA